MSEDELRILVTFADVMRQLVGGNTDAGTFAAQFSALWREWRDSKELYDLNQITNDSIDKTFTAADCYQLRGHDIYLDSAGTPSVSDAMAYSSPVGFEYSSCCHLKPSPSAAPDACPGAGRD